VLQCCVAACCSVLQRVLQRVAACCRMLQNVATFCSVLQRVAVCIHEPASLHGKPELCVLVNCVAVLRLNVSWCVAVCFSVLSTPVPLHGKCGLCVSVKGVTVCCVAACCTLLQCGAE